jgi:protein-tyrosine-phosphatase
MSSSKTAANERLVRPLRKSLRVLFLCTRNSARSQIAEALMHSKIERSARGRFEVASAGASPAECVHPLALEVLTDYGIDWSAAGPKSIESVSDRPWDLIITVCDRAKETCPVFPGQPAFAHWGLDDPSDVEGSEDARRRAFREVMNYLARRIDLLLALPFERLERAALERRAQAIAEHVPAPRSGPELELL